MGDMPSVDQQTVEEALNVFGLRIKEKALRFQRDYEPPENMAFPVPPELSRRLPEIYRPGLYRIYIQLLLGGGGHEPINMLEFPKVKTPKDKPPVDSEELAQLLVGVCYDHNHKYKRQLKYRCRILYHSEQNEPSEAYPVFTINAALFFSDEGSQPEGEHQQMPPHYGYGYGMDGDSPFGQAQIQWLQEMRIDLQNSRTHAENAHGKLYSVIEFMTRPAENQTRLNQQGWDALQKGVEMQAGSQQKEMMYFQQLQNLNAELALAQQKQPGNSGFLQQLLPLLMIGMGDKLGPMAPMLMQMMSGMGQGDGGGDAAGFQPPGSPMAMGPSAPADPVPQAEDAPGPEDPAALDRLTLDSVATPQQIQAHPICSMCRLLDRMITQSERASIQATLAPMEWQALQNVLHASNDNEAAFALLSMASQFDGVRKNQFRALLRPRPRALLDDIGNFLQKRFQGKAPAMPVSATHGPPMAPARAPVTTISPAPFSGEPPRVTPTISCPSCRAPNPKGFRFCGACGGALATPKPTVVETQMVPRSPAPVPRFDEDEPETIDEDEPDETENAEYSDSSEPADGSHDDEPEPESEPESESESEPEPQSEPEPEPKSEPEPEPKSEPEPEPKTKPKPKGKKAIKKSGKKSK